MLDVRSRAAWRSWLRKHHDREPEVWLAIYKKGAANPALSYEEAVEEAICFGWIDGQSKSLDAEKYVQRFTPRTPRSRWSESNVRRARKMIDEGRMTETGLRAFRAGTSSADDPVYVAFLRGINVGGTSVIKMAELREAFESLGYLHVKTVLASGNVIFEAPRKAPSTLVQDIQKGLGRKMGRDITVIVRPLEDLRKLADSGGMDSKPGDRLFVTLVSRAAPEAKNHEVSGRGFEILSHSNGIICSVLHEEPGVGAVQLMSAIEREFGSDVTTRSWETVQKILHAGEDDRGGKR